MLIWKKSEWGGVISDPKTFIADFLYYKLYILVLYFGENVQKWGGGSSPSFSWKILNTGIKSYGTFVKPSFGIKYSLLRCYTVRPKDV